MARTEVITVSMRELDRLKTVQAVVDGQLRPGVAAEREPESDLHLARAALRVQEPDDSVRQDALPAGRYPRSMEPRTRSTGFPCLRSSPYASPEVKVLECSYLIEQDLLSNSINDLSWDGKTECAGRNGENLRFLSGGPKRCMDLFHVLGNDHNLNSH